MFIEEGSMVSVHQNNDNVSVKSINLNLMILFGAFSSILILFLFNNNLAIFEEFRLNLYVGPINWIQNILNIFLQFFYPNISSLIIAILLLIIIIVLQTNPLNWHKKRTMNTQILFTIMFFSLIFAYAFSKITSSSALRDSTNEGFIWFSFLCVIFEMITIIVSIVLIFLINIPRDNQSSPIFGSFTFTTTLLSMFGLLGAGTMVFVSEISFTESIDLFKKCFIAGSVLVQVSVFLLLLTIGVKVVKSTASIRSKIHKINAIVFTVLMLLSYLLRAILLLLYNLVEDFPSVERYYKLVYVNPILYYLCLASFISLLVMGLYSHLKSERFLFKKKEYYEEINKPNSTEENSTEFSSLKEQEFNEKQQTKVIKGSEIKQKLIDFYFSVLLILSIFFYFIMKDDLLHNFTSSYFVEGRTETLIFALIIILLGIAWRKKISNSEEEKFLQTIVFYLLLITGASSLISFVLLRRTAVMGTSFQIAAIFEYLIDIVLFLVFICLIILQRKMNKHEDFFPALIIVSVGLVLSFVLPFLSEAITKSMETSRYEVVQFVLRFLIIVGMIVVITAFIPVIRSKESGNNHFAIWIVISYAILRITTLILATFYPPEYIEELSHIIPPVNFTTSLSLINRISFFSILFLVSFSVMLKFNFKGTISQVLKPGEASFEKVQRKKPGIKALVRKIKKSYKNPAKFMTWKGVELAIIIAIITGAIFGTAHHYRTTHQYQLISHSFSIRGGTEYDSYSRTNVYFNEINNNVYLEITASDKIELVISFLTLQQQSLSFKGSKTIKFKDVFTLIHISTNSLNLVEVSFRIYEMIISKTHRFAIYSPLFLGVIWGIFSSVQIIKRRKNVID